MMGCPSCCCCHPVGCAQRLAATLLLSCCCPHPLPQLPQGAGGFAGAPLSNQGFFPSAQQQQQAPFNQQQQQQPVGQGGGFGNLVGAGLQQLNSTGPFTAQAGMQSAPGSSMQGTLSSIASMDGQQQQG